MNALQWTGEVLTLLILIGIAFIAGLAIGNKESEGKR
jgi:hypothetical protein